jgi:hypothetical protein
MGQTAPLIDPPQKREILTVWQILILREYPYPVKEGPAFSGVISVL